MLTTLLPLFLPDDYKAFRKLLGADLHEATHQEWQDSRDKKLTDFAKNRIRVRQIKVNSQEFAAHCRAAGTSHDKQALDAHVALLAKKADRKKK